MLLRNSTGKGVGMAIRTRAVYPDTGYVLPSGEQIAIVSEETLVDEAVAMLRVAYRVGGIVSVVQDRAQTGVPHEMVTVAAVVQWQDRTDAKPQPEPAAAPVRLTDEAREAVIADGDDPARYEDPEPDAEDEARIREDALETLRATHDGPIPAGWDPEPEELAVDHLPTLRGDPEPDELEAALEDEAREVTEADEVKAMGALLQVGREDPGPVVVGAPVGYETPTVRETAVSHGRPPREQGVGSGALPFQRGGEPGAPPEINLADVVSGSGVPDPQQVPRPSDAKAEFQFDDGLRESSLEEEDDSSIPENLR